MCLILLVVGFPRGTVVKNPPANVGDTEGMTSIPGLGRGPGEGNGNPLWYFCLENSMDRGTWQATVHGIAESDTTEHARDTFTSESYWENFNNVSKTLPILPLKLPKGNPSLTHLSSS